MSLPPAVGKQRLTGQGYEGSTMDGNVLVLGADDRFPASLERLIPGIAVRTAHTAAETEGLDVDVVVIAGPHPVGELTEVRVHPNLYEPPVVLFCPGHRMNLEDWGSVDVWPVTSRGFTALDEVIERVALLLARIRHPATVGSSAGRSSAA